MVVVTLVAVVVVVTLLAVVVTQAHRAASLLAVAVTLLAVVVVTLLAVVVVTLVAAGLLAVPVATLLAVVTTQRTMLDVQRGRPLSRDCPFACAWRLTAISHRRCSQLGYSGFQREGR